MVDTTYVTPYLILLERCLYVICSPTAVPKSWGDGAFSQKGNIQPQRTSADSFELAFSLHPNLAGPHRIDYERPEIWIRTPARLNLSHPRGAVSPIECIFGTASSGGSLSRGSTLSTVSSGRTKVFLVMIIFVKHGERKLGRNERLVSLSHQFSSRK